MSISLFFALEVQFSRSRGSHIHKKLIQKTIIMAEEKTLPHSYNDGKEKDIFVCSEKFPFVGF